MDCRAETSTNFQLLRSVFQTAATTELKFQAWRDQRCQRALINEMEKRDVPVHRLISMVMGATLLSDDELERFAELARDAKLEVIVTPGPRTLWDLGGQVRTPEGVLSGMRIRGMDNVSYLIGDIMRAIEFGFRGFLIING